MSAARPDGPTTVTDHRAAVTQSLPLVPNRPEVDEPAVVEADGPVFVDPSGRRRRAVRLAALVACAVVGCYVLVLVAALLGAPVPHSALLPLPGVVADPTTTTTTAPDAATPSDQASSTSVERRPGASGEPGVAGAAQPTLTAAAPPATTAVPTGGATTTLPTLAHTNNSHAPSEPPGQTRRTDTTQPGPPSR